MSRYRFDPQAFLLSSHDMDGIEFAALETLQYGLAGDPEKAHCLVHREETLWRFIDKAVAQILRQANAPGSSRGQLLTADEAVIEPAVDGRGGGSKDRGRLFDSQQLALGEGSGRLEARDVPLPPQTADMVGGKAVTVSGMTILTVEDTGDDGVWVISGQTANEGDCVLVGAHDCQFLAWQIDIDIGEASTSPPQGEAVAVLGLKHGDDDLFEQRSQQLLAIARRGGRRFPYALQIGAEREQAAPVFCAECSRSFTFAAGELGFGLLELAQALLPLALEAAGDETVLGIDSAIAAFGTLCLVPGTFSGEPALGERIVAIGLEPFGGGESGFETRWSKRGENGACNRVVDLHCTDAQTKDAATIDDVFAGAVVARRRGASGVMSAQPSPARAAGGQSLQQCASFSHGTAGVMGLGMGVGGNARPIGLIGRPVDEAGVMLWDEHRPFGARQLADFPFAPPGRIERDLTPGFSVNISARVNRVCQHMINSGIARVDPPDRCTIMGLHRKGQALAAQPKPDPTHRTEFGKAREDSADRRGHRRIGVKAYFAVFLAPDEAHR